MKIYSAYIVDDERLARNALRNKLEDFPEVEIIGEGRTIPTSAEELMRLEPDVLFLDIQLKGGTGFDLLNMIDYKGKVIFVTAYDEYAMRAFEINALDYLMKPISTERLSNAIKKLKEKHSSVIDGKIRLFKITDRLMINVKNSIKFILISDIVLIEASRDYTNLVLCDGKSYLCSKPMLEWEERLPQDSFCRVHRSFIINFVFITKIEKHSRSALIYMSGIETPVRLSRSYYPKLRERYM